VTGISTTVELTEPGKVTDIREVSASSTTRGFESEYVEHSRNNDLEESGNMDMNPTQSMMPANKKMRSYKSLDGTYENTSLGDLQKLWKNLRRSGSQMYTIEVHELSSLQKL
jgi:hypothetical protein